MYKYLIVAVMILFPLDGMSKEEQVHDSSTHGMLIYYIEESGPYTFVYICRDKIRRYFLLVSKGDESGMTFIIDDDKGFPNLPAELKFIGLESAYVESLGGVYTMHITKELVDKMVKSAKYTLMRDVTPEMLYNTTDVEICKFQIELNISP